MPTQLAAAMPNSTDNQNDQLIKWTLELTLFTQKSCAENHKC